MIRMRLEFNSTEVYYLYYFQVRDSELQLLSTPFANRLDPSVYLFLSTFHSVPGFLGAVSHALLEKQTLMGNTMTSTVHIL